MSEAAINLHIEPLEEGGYVATSPNVPGLVVEGRSLVEVAELAQHLTRTIGELVHSAASASPFDDQSRERIRLASHAVVAMLDEMDAGSRHYLAYSRAPGRVK